MTREEAAERAHDTLCLRRPGGPEEDEAPATEREPTEDEMQAYREQRDRFAESWDCWVERECREAGR